MDGAAYVITQYRLARLAGQYTPPPDRNRSTVLVRLTPELTKAPDYSVPVRN